MRKTLRRVLTFAVALVTASTFALVGAAGANAATTGSTTCSGGLAPGTYRNVTVKGFCFLGGGAMVTGNVTVGTGSILMGDGATINGNVTATNAKALYLLDGSWVGKNVTFTGGGWGRTCTDPGADDPSDAPGHSTMIKDSTVKGNVTFTGWAGCWFGLIRNHVGKNVTVTNMYANPAWEQGPDSTEIASNVVMGNLNCSGNTPAAQFGDSGGEPNTVGKNATGECAKLT